MNKRSLIIAVLFAMGTGMVVWRAIQPRAPQLSVTFLGYTNDASGTRLATLAVSNLSSFVVRRQAHYTMELPTSTGGANQASCWFPSSHDLDARAVEIVAVPAPTNQASWRVLLSIRTNPGIVTETMDVLDFVLFGFQSKFPQRKSYEVRSDWIEEW